MIDIPQDIWEKFRVELFTIPAMKNEYITSYTVRKLIEAAQLPIAPLTKIEVKDVTDYLGNYGTSTVTVGEALAELFSRRNSPPIDPRREKIAAILQSHRAQIDNGRIPMDRLVDDLAALDAIRRDDNG